MPALPPPVELHQILQETAGSSVAMAPTWRLPDTASAAELCAGHRHRFLSERRRTANGLLVMGSRASAEAHSASLGPGVTLSAPTQLGEASEAMLEPPGYTAACEGIPYDGLPPDF